MARNRGNKSKQKAAKKAKSNNQRQASHNIAVYQDNTCNQDQSRRANMIPDEASEASLRGGHIDLAVNHGMLTFNPSTINAHDEGDQDVTLVDVSPAKPDEAYNSLFGEASTVESRGINIFKVQPAPVHLTTEETNSDGHAQRSLEDVLADNPDSKLSNLDGETLAFVGRAVRQVVLEATYGFFQRCIPETERKTLGDQTYGRGNVENTTNSAISIPDGTMDLKNGVRSVSDLIGNCIDILSQDAPVTDQRTLKLSLSRAVTLCDALGDGERKQALEKAACELNWLIVGLDCKTMELYRVANRQLDRINMSYPVTAEENGESGVGVCVTRRREERSILQSMQRAHEGFRESFRVRFIEVLQSLLAL
ncbi:hypothetical protein F5883DRAFT_152677 [Diaporthe sp. PMI_573]|jgi:hypothetical protein|nr:hypothetical protein F5883DRAFT_152677 [Diaporthaceae sp. PMI_573]